VFNDEPDISASNGPCKALNHDDLISFGVLTKYVERGAVRWDLIANGIKVQLTNTQLLNSRQFRQKVFVALLDAPGRGPLRGAAALTVPTSADEHRRLIRSLIEWSEA
jgi:hypothetical protein